MALNPGEATALRNLARKQAGEDVDWINIADARALTELGLAERHRDGWKITPAGLEALKAEAPDEPPEPANTIDMVRRP
jgi:hypothetical protein